MGHLEHAKEVGYDSKLVPSEAVKRLWDILGENETELTDKILDADFCIRSVTIYNLLSDFKNLVHDRAIYPHGDEYAFINLNVFDALLDTILARVRNNAE
jgi:hypothetical protein